MTTISASSCDFCQTSTDKLLRFFNTSLCFPCEMRLICSDVGDPVYMEFLSKLRFKMDDVVAAMAAEALFKES